jgi:hypothetical protein
MIKQTLLGVMLATSTLAASAALAQNHGHAGGGWHGGGSSGGGWHGGGSSGGGWHGGGSAGGHGGYQGRTEGRGGYGGRFENRGGFNRGAFEPVRPAVRFGYGYGYGGYRAGFGGLRGHYETRMVQVWIPGGSSQVWVDGSCDAYGQCSEGGYQFVTSPGHYESRAQSVWVGY